MLCFITQQGSNLLAGLDTLLAENSRQELACLNEEELTTLLDLPGRVKTQLGTLNK